MVKKGILCSIAGDTIVEVMIAILVVGTVLGSSYAAANRYFKNIRQAQEYTNALKIAEGQIEQIKGYVINNDRAPITSAAPFCFKNGIQTGASRDCTIDTLYTSSIARTDATNQYTFTVTVSWSNINGGANSTVTLVYKVYT